MQLDVRIDILLGPVADREDSEILSVVLARVVLLPNLGSLAFRDPVAKG